MFGTSREDHRLRVLTVATLDVCGNRAESLMDYGAIPNVMSLALAERLSIKAEYTTRSITVVTGERSNVVVILRDVPARLDTFEQKMYFLVVNGALFDIMVGYPSMESMEGILDGAKRVERMTKSTKTAKLSLLPNYTESKPAQNDGDREEFTSASSADP